MTQYTLITSPTKIHKKNYKYLNYGCLNLQHEIDEKKDILINHPWDNQKKYQIDANKIKKIYLQFLGEISNKLNGQHKIKKDLRYWKIIIGPWLHSLILAYYEKNLVVNLLLKNKKKLIIPITKTKIEHLIPDSFFSFFAKHIYSESWNDYLFSFIISKKKISKNFTFKEKKPSDIKKLKHNTNKGFVRNLKKFIFTFTSLIFLPKIKNQQLVFFNTYLSLKNKIILLLKNLSFQINLEKDKQFISPNILLRKSLCKNYEKKNDFHNNIQEFLFMNMPTDFLENFQNVGNNISKSKVAKKPKTIFTANGVYSSSVEARYIAECVSKGAKLILAQHGGRYENIKNFFHIDFEVDISDYFISWGKKKDNKKKIKNLGIIKPIKSFKKKIENKILFLMVAKGRYLRTVDSEISVQKLYDYYNEICPKFYNSLEKNLKKKLTFRSSVNNYWNEKEFLEKKCKLSNIDFNRHKSDFLKEAQKSKIVVCSYLSTTFLELMLANIPAILFTPFSHAGYNSETLKAFKKMEKSHIYFRNYEIAAKFINKNWNNIDDWWFSKKTQKSRKYFLNNFAYKNRKLITDIQKLIDN